MSGFYTLGDYSTGDQSNSSAVYVSMDERQKSGFTLGYEKLSISTGEETDYEQYNLLTKDVFWINPELRLGGLAGRFTSNSTDNGWLIGGFVEGDTRFFGYSAGMIQSNFQEWHKLSEITTQWENFDVLQFNFTAARNIGKWTVYAGQQIQKFLDEKFLMSTFTFSNQITSSISFSMTGATGKSRHSIDPYYLILNNNPDILENSLSTKGRVQVNPNWSIQSVYTLQNYEQNRSIQYFSVGIQGRF